MKLFTLVFIGLSLCNLESPAQDMRFRTIYSEPLAVYHFLTNLSSTARANPFKILFAESSYNTKHYNDLVAQFDSLKLDYGYEFTDYPIDQKIGGYSQSFIQRNLILSDNMQDFKVRSMGIVPNARLFNLIDLITTFTPVYEEVIYKPCQKLFQGQLTTIGGLMKTSNLSRYYTLASYFFHSNWDPTIPFIFCFYPLPRSKRFSATAIENVALSAIPDSLGSYPSLLSVMLHEMSHILYDEKPLDLWENIDAWFQANPSKASRYAYNLFNEAMATAVGNGYLYKQLNGKENPGNWYGDKYINFMAKTAYPEVEEYISHQRAMDKQFIDQYINSFEQNFSDWLTEPDFVMTGRYVLSDEAADFVVSDRLYPSKRDNHSPITASTLEEIRKHPTTKLIIVQKNNSKTLGLLKASFPELKDRQFDPSKDFTDHVFLQDKTWLIILNNVLGSTEEKLRSLNLQ